MTHYFDVNRPLQLDEADAIALAAIPDDVEGMKPASPKYESMLIQAADARAAKRSTGAAAQGAV